MITPIKIGLVGAANLVQLEALTVGGEPLTVGGQTLGVAKVPPSLTVAAPFAYQVHQRNGDNEADIVIAGTYTGRNGPVQARWGNEAWETIDADPTDGIYVGVITRPLGQKTLSVRLQSSGVQVDVQYVGVGDIFGIWGQSNGDGRGVQPQTYTPPPGMLGIVLGKDNVWKPIQDPISIGGPTAVDSISNDPESGGSVWPKVAEIYMAAKGFPVAFVPCCRGGQGNGRWWPPADHLDRRTLYGSALYRTKILAGGCKAVLYWAGEPGNADTPGEYGAFKPHAVAIRADMGVPIMRCKLQRCGAGNQPQDNQGAWNSVQWIWDHPAEFNSVVGPDLSTISDDGDGFHLTASATISAAATLWAAAMLAAF